MPFVTTAVPLLLMMSLAAPAAASPDDDPATDSTQVFYARRDAGALRSLLARSQDRAVRLLCRYRLYPLTLDPAYLDDLPDDLDDASARELALLSGLWGYKVKDASVFKLRAYGRRSTELLERAKALDPDEPFVLLVEGQSLLYRPGILGGDKRAALDRFRRLAARLRHTPDRAITPFEADLWRWYTLAKLGDAEAPALRAALLAQNPPPLYLAFLQDPP